MEERVEALVTVIETFNTQEQKNIHQYMMNNNIKPSYSDSNVLEYNYDVLTEATVIGLEFLVEAVLGNRD